MLDTVVLLLDWGNYTIVDHSKFNPTTDGVLNNRFVAGTDFKNNPTSDEKSTHYYPRLTLYTKAYYGQSKVLKIECSLHKLINDGNNVNEYDEYMYQLAITNLQQRMRERGVDVTYQSLLEASVVAFHVGKNISLSGGYTASLAIQELSKVDVSLRKDINETKYRNEGHAFQAYTNSHALVMYDKFADMRKYKKRAIDKDQSDLQLDLLDQAKNTMLLHKLLRIEVRLCNKKMINKTLQKYGIAPNPKLQDILSHELARKLLHDYWTEFYSSKSRFVLDTDTNPLSIFKRTLHHSPEMSIKQAILVTGFHLLAKHAGMRKIRATIKAYRPTADWHNIKRKLSVYESPPFEINTHGFVTDIEQQITDFQPFVVKL